MIRSALSRAAVGCALAVVFVSCSSSESAGENGPGWRTVKPDVTVVYRPANIPRRRKVPLFLTLGGFGGRMRYTDNNTHMDSVARRHGFVVAYPSSVSTFKGRPAWRDASWMPLTDVRHIKSVIRTLIKRGGIDPRRVFVVGTSMGGSMAYRVGCELSTMVAGVGAVGGAMLSKSGGGGSKKACKPAQPVSVLTIFGSRDSWVGGKGALVPSALATSRRWVRFDGCRKTNPPVTVGSIVRRSWSRCRGHAEVGYTLVRGAGHGWPGVYPFLNAGDEFWSFFQGVRLPPRSSHP